MAEAPVLPPGGKIRPLDIHTDLLPAADLIERCFSTTLGEEGHAYLRHVRQAAREPALRRWVNGAGERVSAPLFGYVWEQNGRIIGNLSLIPVHTASGWIYLIANVAVEPEQRGRGIGQALTLRALEHIRAHPVASAWLQVRADNETAVHLYRKTGFIERTVRNSWELVRPAQCPSPAGLLSEPRKAADWQQQIAWLDAVYPPEVRWNLPYHPHRLSPNWWNRLIDWVSAADNRHTAVRDAASGELLGVSSLEKPGYGANLLWLAVGSQRRDEAIQALSLQAVQQGNPFSRGLTLNLPTGWAETILPACGFKLESRLIWMQYDLQKNPLTTPGLDSRI